MQMGSRRIRWPPVGFFCRRDSLRVLQGSRSIVADKKIIDVSVELVIDSMDRQVAVGKS